jgi:uncharacterized protein
MRFWDSSALVPLLVEEAASETAMRWVREDRHVAAWTLTPVEALSAIRRLVRESALAERDAARAEARVEDLTRRLHLVVDVEGTKRVAARLLRTHPLRAADALQLAAAVLWAGNRPDGKILHTFDARLGDAASREGFTVLPVA